MNWKIFSIVCFALILSVLVKWYSDSLDYGQTLVFSREKKEIVSVTKDELFGNETKKMEWKSGFWLGLLPPTDNLSPSIMLGVVPVSSLLLVAAVGGLVLHRRKKMK